MHNPAKTNSRLLAVADIHGYKEELLDLLQKASYNPLQDQLILLGDYIDADNPDTWGTLDTVRRLVAEGAAALLGNQELRLLASTKSSKTLNASTKAWLRKLSLYFIQGPYLFVHAGIRPGVPLHKQNSADLTEIRDEFIYTPLSEQDEARPYTIIFGHTPTFKLDAPGTIWQGERRLAIDTGAKHGYRLTLLDVSGKLSYSCSTSPGSRGGDFRIEPLASSL
ncbi:metallophosphoesterase [Paenibacillus sp. FJAT-27812]|uniref:metallophosphoesterase n=1 Tax=Paenibacillus sp. FJAT-27812 TaxID=1684143 RepID=UPI0006A75D02|nr:metallophosphoesterase [Paenibacillus sp. FJAT-27812]